MSEKPQEARSAHPLDQRIVKVARVVLATKQQVEQLNSAVEGLASHQRHMDELATDLKQRLSDFHERLGAAANGTGQGPAGLPDEFAAQFQKLAERVELVSSKMDDQVFALKSRVTGFADGVEEWFKPARSEIEANREFVDRASVEIREKLQGFERAAQNLQACVDSGVADLQRRHETRDVDLSAVASKLDDCLNRLDQNPNRMGEFALERIRPLIDTLTAHVEESCVGEEQLHDHLRAMQTQIESAVARSEQRVMPSLGEFGTRLAESETVAAEIRETCRALQNQLGGAVGQLDDRMAGVEKSVDTALGADLDDRLTRIEGQMAETLSTAADGMVTKLEPIVALLQEQAEGRQAAEDRVNGRLAGIQEGLESWGRHSEDDAVHRTELSCEQKELGAALGRLEEKIEVALDTNRKQTTDSGEQTAGVVRQLDTISEQLDARVARSLSEIHAQNIRAQEATTAQQDELAGGQKELSMAMLRLQGSVTESLTDLTEQQTRHREQAGHLAGELGDLRGQLDVLGDLREQVATLGDQLGVMTAEIDNRVATSLTDAERGTREQIASIKVQLGATLDRMQGVMEKTLNDPRSEDREQISRVERHLTDLREHLVSLGDQFEGVTGEVEKRVAAALTQNTGVESALERELSELKSSLAEMPGQVQDKVSEAVAEFGRTSSREQEQLTAVERQLDDIRELVSNLGDRLTGMSAEAEMRGSEASGDPSEMREQIASLQRLLDKELSDLKASLAAVPGQVEGKVADAITRSDRIPSREQEQLTGVERQLDDLREHIATMSDRLENVSGDFVQSEHVTREHLNDMVGQLEQQMTTVIGEVAVRESDGELSRQLEGQLDGLQSQLGMLGERFGALESSLTQLEAATRAGSGMDHGHVQRVEEIPADFECPPEPMDHEVTVAPERIRPTNDKTSGFFSRGTHVDRDEPAETNPVESVLEPDDFVVADEPDKTSWSDAAASPQDSPVSEDAVSSEEMIPADDDVVHDEPAPHDEPDTPAMAIDELVDTMINVINSGNPELIASFVAEQYSESALAEGSVAARVEVYMDIHEATGEMRVVTSDVGDEGEIVVILQTRLSLDRQRFEIIRNTNSHKIDQVNISRI